MSVPVIGRELEVSNDHLAVATLWLELATAGQELVDAGLARDGRLAPRLGELLDVMLRPMLRVHVEVLTPTSVEVDLLWMGPDLVVTGALLDGRLRLGRLDPIFLLPDLARRVGLGRGEAIPADGRLEIRADLLDDLEGALGSDDGDPDGVLDAAGIRHRPWRTGLVDVVRHRRSTWRLVATWTEADGEVTSRTLRTLDGGRAGRAEILEGSSESSVLLVPRSSTELFATMRACLPSMARQGAP
jgi:hypothetical protein